MKPSELLDVAKVLIKNREPLLVKGKPGVGKTDVMKQAAEECDFELIVSHPVVSDPVDFKGLPFVINDVADFLPLGDLKTLVTTKKNTVFFLDDLGQAAPAVQAAAMQLILARHIGEHKVSDKVTFIAATNRKEDKAGVSGILEPVKSRFTSIVELDVNVEDWFEWALNHGMPQELLAFIRWRPTMLDHFQPTSDIENSACPRTVANVGRLIKLKLAPEIENQLIQGAAGQAFASEYLGFREVFTRLPDPMTVLMNPKAYFDKHPVSSDRLDILCALVITVTHRVDMDNYKDFFNFVSYLPGEYGVMAVRTAMTLVDQLRKTEELIKFLKENQDIIV